MTLTRIAGHYLFGVLFLLLNLNFITLALGQDLPYSKYQKGLSSLNFGVVKNNSTYKIYRSSYLNKSKLKTLDEHLSKNDLEFPSTIIYMNSNGYGGWASGWTTDAIQEYEESFKYGFDYFHPFNYDYRTYLEGENPYIPEDDIDQGKYVNSKSKDLFGFYEDKKKDGGVDAFIRIMNLVLDPTRGPVLFHCKGGKHRTGMIAMMLRYIEGGEWVNGPKKAVKVSGKTIEVNPAEYEYLLHTGSDSRINNINFIRKFVAEEDIFQEWVDNYRALLQE